jgi:NAD-dependent SIR2 family protein deacetylase
MTNDDETRRALAALQAGERVVWLTGAGLSVASGLSPYRKSRDAVWANFITDWGTIERFHEDPTVWYREFWFKAHGKLVDQAGQIRPNAGHDAIMRFLRRHEHHGVITQNIDGLHIASGTPRDRTIEIHGRHDTYCCANAACRRAREPVTGLNFTSNDAPPHCTLCGSILRPVVLLFDEYYESHPLYRAREAQQWLNAADVVVFVGTSFSVGITAMALQAARYNEAKLINVNLDPIDELGFLNVLGPSEQTLPALADAAGV